MCFCTTFEITSWRLTYLAHILKWLLLLLLSIKCDSLSFYCYLICSLQSWQPDVASCCTHLSCFPTPLLTWPKPHQSPLRYPEGTTYFSCLSDNSAAQPSLYRFMFAVVRPCLFSASVLSLHFPLIHSTQNWWVNDLLKSHSYLYCTVCLIPVNMPTLLALLAQ